ncbi:hypothetical protein HY256_10795 [Candidatus Sumerlaeota bacterium]|nr:hypothetical protein [Candidatus Sumerlaeota bacterium]
MPSIRGNDGMGNYAYLMSMLNDADLNFANDYAAFDSVHQERYRMSDAPVNPRTERPANRYGIGAAMFWAPAVLPVHLLLERISPDQATGLTPPYEWGVALASAWWGGLGVWLLLMRLRERFNARVSWTAAAGMLLATPLGFYIWAHGSMSHAVRFFIGAIALLTFEKTILQPTLGSVAALGIFAGFLLDTRAQDATWAAALIGGAFLARVKSKPHLTAATASETGGILGLNPLVTLAICLWGFFLAVLPQLVVWNYLYGSWLSGPAPYLNREAGAFDLLPIHAIQALFSSRHGALAWHPILIVALAGLVLGARRRGGITGLRTLCVLGLAGLMLQLYLVGSWSMWWAGASFGNRFFISSYPFLFFGAAIAFDWIERRFGKWTGPFLVCLLVFWNAGLLIQYGTEMIPREEPAGWGDILINQFVQVPAWVIERVSSVF